MTGKIRTMVLAQSTIFLKNTTTKHFWTEPTICKKYLQNSEAKMKSRQGNHIIVGKQLINYTAQEMQALLKNQSDLELDLHS
jgi:hypothetical protein